MHAQLAHIAERHRRAGGYCWCRSMDSAITPGKPPPEPSMSATSATTPLTVTAQNVPPQCPMIAF